MENIKKSFKSTAVKALLVIILSLIIVPVLGTVNIQAAKKTKEYPERDKSLPEYKYLTAFPDAIYNTYASENGLGGNCYFVSGTVKGVYKGLSKVCKALKIDTKNIDKSSVTEEVTYILVKTKKGYVIVSDLFSYTVETTLSTLKLMGYSEKEISSAVKEYKTKYSYYEPYDQLPQKGEKVKICAIYSGFSNVTKTPMFYYGINQYLVQSMKDEKIDPDAIETNTYKYENIKMEIPKDWTWVTGDDDYKYFYSPDGFVMVSSMYLYGYSLTDTVIDIFLEELAGSNLTVTATKKNTYKNKQIKDYYISSLKGKISGTKVKVRTTMFEYKGDLYSISYVSKLTDDSDTYFDIYSNIIKSVKPLK